MMQPLGVVAMIDVNLFQQIPLQPPLLSLAYEVVAHVLTAPPVQMVTHNCQAAADLGMIFAVHKPPPLPVPQLLHLLRVLVIYPTKTGKAIPKRARIDREQKQVTVQVIKEILTSVHQIPTYALYL